jgi:acyl-CoA synthetase (AMP-forming)/AMP-acid ligase II
MGDALVSYASGASAAPLLGETIGENLERAAARYPGREALVDVAAGRRWTYAELDAAVNEVALGLLAMGIAKGERVGIWAPNCAEWVLTQYATAKIGAILVNVNPAYRAYELDYVIRQSGMRLIISAAAHRGSDYRAMLANARTRSRPARPARRGTHPERLSGTAPKGNCAPVRKTPPARLLNAAVRCPSLSGRTARGARTPRGTVPCRLGRVGAVRRRSGRRRR